VLIPRLVFQAAWLTDLMLLLLGLILAYSLYTLVRWASTRREAGQR
jgi:cytochrome c oxidase assembly factor CtaG